MEIHVGHYVLFALIFIIMASLAVIIGFSKKFADEHNHNSSDVSNFGNSPHLSHKIERKELERTAKELENRKSSIRREIEKASS